MSDAFVQAVLAANPKGYWRLNTVGPASDGQTVPDSSGNEHDGAVILSGDALRWGYAPAVQTDSTAKEFEGFTNTDEGREARIEVPSHADFEADDFTVLAFIRPETDLALAIDLALAAKSGSYGLLHSWSGGGKLGGYAIDSAGTLWKAIDTSFQVTDYLNEPFYCVVTRNGNTLAFYVNNQLRATTTISSGLPTRVTGTPIWIHPDTPFALKHRYTEVAFFDYAISALDRTAIWEASLTSLPVSLTFAVRANLELDTSSTVPTDFPFAHNFADAISGQRVPIVETLSYHTNVNQSTPDYQQRVNVQPHGPDRSIEYRITPASVNARARLQAALWEPAQLYKPPIWTDWTELTAQASSGANVLNCDTTLRDFEVGSYCVSWTDVFDPRTYQFFKILSLTDTAITIVGTVDTTLPIGSEIAPSRLARIPEDIQVDSYLVDRETLSFKFDILNTELSTRRKTTYVPTSTHHGLEILSLTKARFDWLDPVSYQINRRVEGTGIRGGNGYQRAIDSGSPRIIPARVTLTTREALAEFYGWLDARQGKQVPLWVPTYDNDFELISSSLNSSIVRDIGYSTLYNQHRARRDLIYFNRDGTQLATRINDSTDNMDGTEGLALADSPGGPVEVERVSFLRQCTLAQDTFELTFHRDLSVAGGMIVECGFSFVELLTSPA